MSRLSIADINAELDIEYFLQRESLAYRETRGVSGTQLNIKSCPNPVCRDGRWRTYFGIETGRGNCFVCSKSYNAVGFIHDYFDHGDNDWGQTFRECEEIMREQGWRPKRQAVAAVDHGDVKLPVSEPLPLETGENLAYLETRGFGPDICKYFNLRWCEYGWWMFKTPEGETKMQNFGDRIIIPVFDLDGSLKTFQGRDLLPGLSEEQKALGMQERQKYLFPMELPGTGRYLLNGQNVLATDHVVMGEGVFDVAATKLAYDEDPALRHIVPIGSFGKHLSYGNAQGDDQLGRFIILRTRGVKIITIMWDGGEKELIAALNAAKMLTGIGFTVRIALLPFEKDPNEVTGDVVRKAHYEAKVWTPKLDIMWRMKNPYTPARKAKEAALAAAA
jgi:DNA primase